MILSLIVATTKNNVIGKNNQMPWHLPADLAWFRQNTTGKPVIMGRKTFESIGKPLPKRTNIVLSRNKFQHENVLWAKDWQSAVDFVKDFEEIMLIGGGELFKQMLPQAGKLYLTQIQTELDGDTFFPELNWKEWEIQQEIYRTADENNAYDCRFLVLTRS
ncbi:dihydrofolate reductase [Cricetibacter osteomyelitidis]|uniref:Dihydrofolate reductase n=1 Tax=Cricetibacter osteomyelitidis TaxID=1521931 RepID=A0A4R2T1L0_9PAST|nr:type 3 dihydrofolate reductase [Cricetibacter osteomyelitidis]TCP95016.1 dihydrofolate reductase [Cricetibacter osteomyelitidis]